MARDLRLFYLFRLLATSYVWLPLSVLFLMDRGMSFRDIMLLSVLYSGVLIAVEVPTGAMADRIGRRQSMMLGALFMTGASLIAWHSQSFGEFAAAEVLAAMSMGLCSGADSAYLFDLLHENGRGHEYAEREAVASSMHLAGCAAACVAGGLLGEIDLGLPYLITAGTTGSAFLVALFMRDDRRLAERRVAGQPLGEELRDWIGLMLASIRDTARNRRLGWIIIYSAVVFALLCVARYLYQPFLNARGFAIWQTGLVLGGMYAVAAVVAYNTDRLRRWLSEPTLIWVMLGMLAISFLLLHRVAGPFVLALLAVQAATTGLYSPLVKPIVNREIRDSGRRATGLSVESIARRVATLTASLVAGFYGAYSAIYLCGALALAGLLGLVITSRYAPSAPATVRPEALEAAVPPTVD
jgi:MFS family permease